jgi:hypothetical protein
MPTGSLGLYNVAPRVGGLTVAVRYTAGNGAIVLSSIAGLPSPPFRLTIVTAASRLLGLEEVLTVFGITMVNSLTNVLTISGPLEGTSDQNFAIGDLAEIRDCAGAITDLNNAVQGMVPTLVLGIVAAGNSQGTATQLASLPSIQEVITVPSGSGVVLPPPSPGAEIIVINAGVNSLEVYPGVGFTINNNSSPLTFGPTPPAAKFIGSSTTNWYSV